MTSLSSLKNSGELFAELLMSRTGFDGSFLVVEGDDDSRFWRRKVAKGKCDLVIAGGRLNVEGLITRVDTHRFGGTLGLVDADFSGIDGTSPSPNLIYTEHHDLEALLLQSSALDAVLVEYGDKARIEAFEARSGQRVVDALLARGLPYGRLRWLSQRLSLCLNFTKIPPARFIGSDWHFDVDGLHDVAASLCNLPRADLLAHLAALPDTSPWMLCQGHDLLHILNLGLGTALGRHYPGHDALGKLLRQAFQLHEFQASPLYRDIRSWEARNPPYLVLAPDPASPIGQPTP
ncbi:MAG TPA: DUF4435 domain-containing protein [Nannocystis sp.]|jgi:hypothetical protein